MYMQLNTKVKINQFDDGNIIFKKYENIWVVENIMHDGGKVRLRNFIDKNIIIYSISTWKLGFYKNE